MKSSRRDSRNSYNRKEKIYLSSENIRKRIWIFLLVLTIAIVSFGYAIKSVVNFDPGWTQIEVSAMGLSVYDDFYLLYNLGQNGGSASAERKAVATLYKQLVVDGYYLFDKNGESDQYVNVAYINKHPNEKISVDDGLYNAFKQIVDADSNYLFMGPVYEVYQGVLQCDQDYQTDDYNPLKNEEIAQYFQQIISFINNGDISIELLADNNIILHVSDQYLQFGKENGIEAYIDFGWLRNSFVADYMAKRLEDNGYGDFILVSSDGYLVARNYSNIQYAVGLYDYNGKANDVIGNYGYDGKCCLVQFKQYPVTNQEYNNYYLFEDGSVLSPYCSLIDGKNYNGCEYLIASSDNYSCSQIALKMADYYICQQIDVESLKAESNLKFICLIDKTIYTSNNVTIENVADGYTVVK